MNLLFLLIIFIQSDFIQKNQLIELSYFNTDSFYYNVVQSADGILVGSDRGVFKVLENGVELLDSSLKGPITVYKNLKIEKGEILYSDRYSSFLPALYKNSLQTFLETPTTILIVSRGDLFVFKKADFKFESSPSIRSISKNYLGTYNGIFKRSGGIAFTEPTYTNSHIREFDSIVFINWYGLVVRFKSQIKNYTDKNGAGIKIGDELLHTANDVALLKYPEFLLLTGKGIYQFNIQTEVLTLIRPNNSGIVNFIRDEKNINGVERVFLHDEENVFKYNLGNGSFVELIKHEGIIDVFSNTESAFYVLTKSGLHYYDLFDSKNSKKLIDNENGYHTIGNFKDFIFLMSDNGLHLYSLKSNRITSVIKDEFNRKAQYITKDTLFLGSVNGLYRLDYDTVSNLYLNNVKPYPKKSLPWYLYLLILSLAIMLLLGIWIYRLKTSKEIKHYTLSEKNILKFIKKNLNTVSIESICLEFNVNQNEIYKILRNEKKPGELIRGERIKVVREMRKKKKSEEEISSATGFSISYLKKI